MLFLTLFLQSSLQRLLLCVCVCLCVQVCVNDIASSQRKDTTLAWTLISEVNTQHG